MTDVHVQVGKIRTGEIEYDIPVESYEFETRMNDSGTASVTVPLSDPDVNRLFSGGAVRAQAPLVRSFLAISVDGKLEFAGPIVRHDYLGDELIVQAQGLWWILDRRIVWPANLDWKNDPSQSVGTLSAADTVYTGLTLRGIARRLTAAAIAQFVIGTITYLNRALPIVHPDGSPISTDPGDELGDAERTYRGYDLNSTGDMLRNLTGVIDGPDVIFTPRYLDGDSSRVEWVMRRGDPILSSGPPLVFDAASGLNITRVVSDGARMVNRGWATGDGSEVGKVIARAQDFTLSGYPLVEDVEAHPTVVNMIPTLVDHAQAMVATRGLPIDEWRLFVLPDGTPAFADYREGDFAVLSVIDHPYLGTGDYAARIIGRGVSSRKGVELIVAPMEGSI